MCEANECKTMIEEGNTSLGIEFGSTRIKGILLNGNRETIAHGEYSWQSHLVDGLWSYDLDEVWQGVREVYAQIAQQVREKFEVPLTCIGRIGFSAMMHGYLAFNAEGDLLVPFRTWQNTNTHEAHEQLSELFQFNIPERWSIAHLYQCVLNGEEHVEQLDFITTLAGYVHWKLTDCKVIGIGDASGMFPIDSTTHHYDQQMMSQFNALPQISSQPWVLEDLLPEPLVAGTPAGELTQEGARLLDPTGVLQAGAMMAPPEGDAGTGMIATDSVRPRTGNVSAGTSIFATVVLERPLASLRPEVDVVATPAGDLAGMSHANNFTADLNAWVGLFREFSALQGTPISDAELYASLFNTAIDAEVDLDADGIVSFPFRTGEFLAGLAQGRPLVVRGPESQFNIGNFMRAQLFAAFCPVTIGMRVMSEDEDVAIDSMIGHGGIFATPVVAQRLLAAAFGTPIRVMQTASQGGAWGMAILADYLEHAHMPLAQYLDQLVFADAQMSVQEPQPRDVEGFNQYFARFKKALPIESQAIESLPIHTAQQ